LRGARRCRSRVLGPRPTGRHRSLQGGRLHPGRTRVAGRDWVVGRQDDVRAEARPRVSSRSDGTCPNPVVQRAPGRPCASCRSARRGLSAAGVPLRPARRNCSQVAKLVRKRARPEDSRPPQALHLVRSRRLFRRAGGGSPSVRLALGVVTRRLDPLPCCLGPRRSVRRGRGAPGLLAGDRPAPAQGSYEVAVAARAVRPPRRGWNRMPRAEPETGSCRSCPGRSGWPPRCRHG
jgi:hypothetical protein